MKLTILGSGTCVSGLPGVPNRYPPAFLLEWNNSSMLFDCSEGTRFRLEQAGHEYTQVHHIAISHAHPDHNALIHFLQAAWVKGKWGGEAFRNLELHVYCPRQVADEFPAICKQYLPELEGKFYDWPGVTFHSMTDAGSQSLAVESATLRAYNVVHGFGKVDALGFRLQTHEGVFAYSGDTGDCDGVRALAQGADLFVCEASARVSTNGKAYGHLNPCEAGSIARESGVSHLILFHYTGLDTDEVIEKDVRQSGFAGTLTIGKDFRIVV